MKCYGYGVEADEAGTRDQCAEEVRATPLTATPLADALARAEEGVRYWTDLAQAEARDAATLRARVAALEAAHTEALDALEKLCAAQKHVLEVRCAGDDEYMAACDGAESILAKAGRR